ncbi:Histidine decarboxylase [compost metagenome]
MQRALDSLEVAAYAVERLNEIGIKAWRNPSALTVVFPQPTLQLCLKWQIATENGQSHIICMPGITREKIDEFVLDLVAEMELAV